MAGGTPASQNIAGQISLFGPNPQLNEAKQATESTRDPFQAMLLNMLMRQFQESPATVPGFTMGALEQFTKNPSLAAEYFPQLAKPLLSALQPQEEREITQLTDMFRKAGIEGGAQQSGAFAQSGRQLIGDQANRRQEVLAKNYIPLTSQLSENMTNNIRAGLNLPGAKAAGWQIPAGLAGSLGPIGSRTESIQGGTGLVNQNAQVAQQALQDQKIADWRDWMSAPVGPALSNSLAKTTPWVDPLADRKLPGYNPY